MDLKYSFRVWLAVIGILCVLTGAVSAQDDQSAKIKVSADEAKAIKKIEDAKTVADKIKATNDFLKKYPKSPVRGQAASYLAGQITQIKDDAQIIQSGETYLTIFSEPAEADLILPSMVYSYSAASRHQEAFAAAEKYFSRHAEEVPLRVKLAIEGSNLLRGGKKDFAAQSRDYAAQAIALIEANKKPASMTDADWKDYQTKQLAQLYQTLGVYEFYEGDKTKARAHLEKATQVDADDINSWILLGTMLDDEYQAVASKYNAAGSGAERNELLKQANEKLDQVIELFARVVALTNAKAEAKQINEQFRQTLEGYYKYRHKSLDGLPALIGKYSK